MNYLGFLCLGLGIFTSAFSLLCVAIGSFSKELPIRQKALFYAKCVIPIAMILVVSGVYLVFLKTPTPP